MGVPSFYRWLVNKYPNVVVKAKQPKEEDGDRHEIEEDSSFDNLYLDMNGIIHPCFHPEDQDPPTTFDEVFQIIFEYIDWLFKIVRPKKLLFLAIDGVAPRAKMNQQRSRRFRTAKDAEISDSEEERLRREFERAGKRVLPKQEFEVSDSNIITPGTEFMDKLAKALQVYIRGQLNSEPGWRNIKVILSDANSPGEGEHKIMKFIRLQRNLPGYNPNTRHCLYGLDADLLMLALATHEIHFSILREDVLENQSSFIQALQTSIAKSSTTGLQPSVESLQSTTISRKPYKKPYQFLNIWTLREYLEHDLKISEPLDTDFERIVDDFIFICFFTGNDFLPHMPSLEIRECAIDLLMTVYRDEFKSRGDYLVDTQRLEDEKASYVNLRKVEKFILSVGKYEERIFKKRMNMRQLMIKRLMREMVNNEDNLEIQQEDSVVQAAPIGDLYLNDRNKFCNEYNSKVSTSESDSMSSGMGNNMDDVLKNTIDLKEKLKDVMREKSDIFKQGGLERDKIRFGMHGWKERYYQEKFCAESPKEIESLRKDIAEKYIEGLCWVLQYYFYGVRSWTWFYPYHYAPFASDLKGLGKVKISFDMGTPFKPFDQLMGVLPPRSVGALPKAYRGLIASEKSNLIDFYPTDFDVDFEGKRFLWQGILKLPFIDEKRLLSETEKLENELQEDEVKRNSEHKETVFVLKSHDFGLQVLSLYEENASLKPNTNVVVQIDTCASSGMNGFISPFSEESGSVNYSLCEKGLENRVEDYVVCVTYENPCCHPHIPRLHENVTIPEKTITETDIVKQPLWHEYEGHRPPNRFQTQDRYRKAINGEKSASSDRFSEKEVYKGAGSGWSAGRGKWNPESPASFDSSSDMGHWCSGRGRGHMEASWNRTSESCRQIQPSFGNGRGYMESPRPMQTISGSSFANGNWVSTRGKGYVVSPRNQTSSSYNSMHTMNAEKGTSPSIGRAWAGAGSNEGLYRGKGYVDSSRNSIHPANVGNMASPSVGRARSGAGFNKGLGRGNGSYTSSDSGRGWSGEGYNEGLGRGKGYVASPRNQTSNTYSSIDPRNIAWSGAGSNEVPGRGNGLYTTSNSGPAWVGAGYHEALSRGNGYVESSPSVRHAWAGGGSNGLGRGNGSYIASNSGRAWARGEFNEGLGRGKGYIESSRIQTSSPYSSVHTVNVGMMSSPPVGPAWAGAGSNEGFVRGNVAWQSGGPSWSGAVSNQGQGRGNGTYATPNLGWGVGSPGGNQVADSSYCPPRNARSGWRPDSPSRGRGS